MRSRPFRQVHPLLETTDPFPGIVVDALSLCYDQTHGSSLILLARVPIIPGPRCFSHGFFGVEPNKAFVHWTISEERHGIDSNFRRCLLQVFIQHFDFRDQEPPSGLSNS